MLGCTLNIVEYENGLSMVAWDSVIVVINTLSPTVKTNLGCKIGDTYSYIKKKHEKIYKSYISDYFDPPKELPGWYENKTSLLIFDFNKNDSSMYSNEVKDDQKTEEIILLYESWLN